MNKWKTSNYMSFLLHERSMKPYRTLLIVVSTGAAYLPLLATDQFAVEITDAIHARLGLGDPFLEGNV